MRIERLLLIFGFAMAGWLLCGATIGVGFALTSPKWALIAHAIAAPLVFGTLSFIYFRYLGYTSPLATSLLWLSLVMALDLLVVALLIERSFVMFTSVLGTWLPFALIFISVWAVGALSNDQHGAGIAYRWQIWRHLIS